MMQSVRALFGSRQPLTLSEEDLETHLDKFCSVPDPKKGTTRISENDVQRIRVVLKSLDEKRNRNRREEWYSRPRTYSILRNIGCLKYMDSFIEKELNDFHLPYNEQTLPEFIERCENNDPRQAFLHIQDYFLSDFKEIELESSKHKHFMFQDSGNARFAPYMMLGQGGFGAVDLVFSQLSFKWYARKRVVRGRDSESNRRVQSMIIEELKQMKLLSYRHLVKIVGSYTDKQYIAYLMTPIAHGTLEQFLNQTHPLNLHQLEALRRFYGCLAGAVHYLHKNQIRHRDLTARNILIHDESVYISDFGSAYNWAHRPNSNTQHMNIPVSPDYMAPEIARKEPVGSSSDMWSLGIIFLEMTTRLLGRQIHELKEQVSLHARKTKAPSYIYANHPVVTSWMEALRVGNITSEQDNEPLTWIADLLRPIPKERPSSVILMKDISETLSFTKFCCFKCHDDFQDGRFAYDSPHFDNKPRQNTQELLNTVSTMFQDDTSAQSLNSLSVGRRNSIEEWIGDTTEFTATPNPQHNQYPDTIDTIDTYSEAASEEYFFADSYDYLPPSRDNEDVSNFTDHKSLGLFPDTNWHPRPNVTCLDMEQHLSMPHRNHKNFRSTGLAFLEYDSGSSDHGDKDQIFHEISEYSGSDCDEDKSSSSYNTAYSSPQTSSMDRDFDIQGDSSENVKMIIQQYLLQDISEHSEPEDELDYKMASGQKDYRVEGKKHVPTLNDLGNGDKEERKEHKTELTKLTTIPEVTETISKSTDIIELGIESSLQDDPVVPPSDHTEQKVLVHSEKEKQPATPMVQNTQEMPTIGNVSGPLSTTAGETLEASNSCIEPSTMTEQTEKGQHDPKVLGLAPRSDSAVISTEEETSRINTNIPSSNSTSTGSKKPSTKPRKPQDASGLSAANIRALNSKDQLHHSRRTLTPRPDIGVIDAQPLFLKTLESASIPSSSTTTTRFQAKISGILLPSKSLEKTHGLLKHYCGEGNYRAVRKLLQQGCNPGSRSSPRPSIIRAAVQGRSQRHIKCVQALIDHKVDVNAGGRHGKMPLHMAIENDYFEGYATLIWLLVQGGADVNTKDPNGDSPLIMLFHGCDTLPLEQHRLDALVVLLKADADVNIQLAGTGNTPLHLAVRRQDKLAVAMLLYMGARVRSKNFAGMTPIQLTTNQFRGELSLDHAQVLDLLLRHIKDKYKERYKEIIDEPAGELKRTPLHRAIATGTAQAVDMLIKSGASTQIQDSKGNDAIAIAIKNVDKLVAGTSSNIDDHVEIMTLLNQASGSNWPMDKGNCTIKLACIAKNLSLLRKLRGQGLHPDQKFQGYPLLHLTIKHRRFSATRLLIKEKAPVDDTDAAGITAVTAAIFAKQIDLALEMIREGEFRDPKNKVEAEKQIADLNKEAPQPDQK
ncbi:hypothetical protein F5Y02DRAFT_382788 [Annulohypoxylon stygium]|nr:hypothetical protein F5Y02DRAFT_382788 [Annulohypoxylon stygium]